MSIPGITHTTGCVEWHTPEWLWKAAEEVMGGIDLDPCSNSKTNPTVPAYIRFTKEDDGLAREWSGRMYMNPPWGRGIEKWVKKAVASYEEGDLEQAVLALPASTETRWFSYLWDYPICFARGRCFFILGETGEVPENGGPTPVAYVYMGPHKATFVRVFSTQGAVVEKLG